MGFLTDQVVLRQAADLKRLKRLENYLAIYDSGSPLIGISGFRPHERKRRMYVNEDPLA